MVTDCHLKVSEESNLDFVVDGHCVGSVWKPSLYRGWVFTSLDPETQRAVYQKECLTFWRALDHAIDHLNHLHRGE